MGVGFWLRSRTVRLVGGARRQEAGAGGRGRNVKASVICHFTFVILFRFRSCPCLLLLPPASWRLSPAPVFSRGINTETKLVIECGNLRAPVSKATAFAHDHR